MNKQTVNNCVSTNIIAKIVTEEVTTRVILLVGVTVHMNNSAA